MIVPEYWAEARQQVRRNGRQVTVRRFGWSDDSQEAAQAHAEQRTREALDAVLAGQDVPRREQRSSYGVHGVPIREQIVERHGDVVVTRNSYGALCLNTPNVLFVDMDFEPRPSGWALPGWGGVLALLAGFVAGWVFGGLGRGLAGSVVVLVGSNLLALWLKRRRFDRDGGAERRALARVEAFVSDHPDWHLRLYRTPAGLRILAMQETFLPEDDAVRRLFAALDADPLYSTMCRVQHCFRARLTAKPWRIGIRRRIRPPFAAWSREQADLPERLAWITEYERRAAGFAACHYVRTLGDASRVDPAARRVQELHDAMTRAGQALPLA